MTAPLILQQYNCRTLLPNFIHTSWRSNTQTHIHTRVYRVQIYWEVFTHIVTRVEPASCCVLSKPDTSIIPYLDRETKLTALSLTTDRKILFLQLHCLIDVVAANVIRLNNDVISRLLEFRDSSNDRVERRKIKNWTD